MLKTRHNLFSSRTVFPVRGVNANNNSLLAGCLFLLAPDIFLLYNRFKFVKSP